MQSPERFSVSQASESVLLHARANLAGEFLDFFGLLHRLDREHVAFAFLEARLQVLGQFQEFSGVLDVLFVVGLGNRFLLQGAVWQPGLTWPLPLSLLGRRKAKDCE